MAALQPGATKLFVQQLPANAAEVSLRQFFGQYGEVADVFMPKDRMTGMGKGTAFVTFADASIVPKVVAAGAQQEIAHGVFILVEVARPREAQGFGAPAQAMPGMMMPGMMMGQQAGAYTYQNGTTRPPDAPKIFCSNVPPQATTELMKNHFMQYGPVTDCYIPMHPGTQTPKGTAFVTFADETGTIVDSVCSMGQQHDLGSGVVITVEKARPKDPSYHAKFGGGKGGAGAGYGAVRALPSVAAGQPYAQPMGQQQMMQQMMQQMGMAMPGMQMQMPATPGAYKPLPPAASSGDRLFITKIAPAVDRTSCEQYFRQFGEVADFFMPMLGDRHKGIAFVTYSEPGVADAVKAQAHVLAGSTLVVETAVARHAGAGPQVMQQTAMGVTPQPTMGAAVQMQAMAASPDGLAPNEEGKFKIFVAQLDFNATTEQLMAEFSQWGQVDDVYIPKNPATGQPKGIAYVTFAMRESAAACLQAPAPIFGGRPVNCMPSTPKGGKGAGKGGGMQQMMMPMAGMMQQPMPGMMFGQH